MSLDPTIAAGLGTVGSQQDDEIDLAGTAVLLARASRPEIAPEPYERHLQRLIQEVGDYAGQEPDLDRQYEALVQVIARRYGYAGTEREFDTIEAGNLMHVIDRRAGLPVALGVLYIDAARKLGWSANGVDFPGRFLVRLDAGGERRIIDPFDKGVSVDAVGLRHRLKSLAGEEAELRPDYYAAMSARAVLLRLEGNVRVRLVAAQKWQAASEIVERMLLIAPDSAMLWREQGMLQARLDRVHAAIASLEESLRRCDEEPARYKTSALIQELRQRLP